MPARTTAQNTTTPRQTPTPDEEQAAKNKSKPRSPHSATAAVRMDVCAPGRVPNPCRLRNSRRPDGRVCARQGTKPLPATNQPPSGRTCVRPAVNPAPAGYETAAVRMDVCAPGSEPSPCRLRNSCRPDGRVCAWQRTQPLPATNQPPSGRTCVRPAVNPASAGYEPAAVRRDVFGPGSEPSPCRLRNSRRPEGRVSTRRARTARRTGYRTTGPAPPGGVSAQFSQTTRPTVPHPATPAMTHHPATTTIHARPPPHT